MKTYSITYKNKFTPLIIRRNYSVISSNNKPIPIISIDNLHKKENIIDKRDLLVKKAGIL